MYQGCTVVVPAEHFLLLVCDCCELMSRWMVIAENGCAGCVLHSPLVCSEHQQGQGGVHHPSLEIEMSQLTGFRRKLLCPTEQGALIPLITGAAKPELKEQKFFVPDTASGLSM